MPIISILVVLIVIGLLMWLVNTYLPIAQPFKTIINVIVILCVAIWLLQVFGVMGSLGQVSAPRLR